MSNKRAGADTTSATPAQTTRKGCSRRSFLKGSAAVAAAAGVSGLVSCAPKQAGTTADKPTITPVEEEIYPGTCFSYCTGGCSFNLHVRDGKLARVSMREFDDPAYNRICQKGLAQPYRVYSASRLTNPLRRAGERGDGQWEEITWDEAASEIAEKWTSLTDQYGPGAMMMASLTGNIGELDGAWGSGSIYYRFMQATGASGLSTNADAAAPFAYKRMTGTGQFGTSNDIEDLVNSKVIFIWGANPAVSQVQTMHFITQARDKGAKLIVIDPLYNSNAALADEYVPVKPATDGALALGMMNVIISNGWEDRSFITDHTVAPYLVDPETHLFLRLSDLGLAEAGSDEDEAVVTDGAGSFDIADKIANPQIEGSFEVNGKQYDTAYSLLCARIAEWPVGKAAEACGIDESTIIELARTYAQDGPCAIYTVYGADHYYNGHWNYHCMFTLPLLTGNIGKPGAGIGPYCNNGAPVLNTDWVYDCPSHETGGAYYNAIQFYDMAVNHTYNGEPCEVRGIYVAHYNPVANMADRTKTIEAFKALDLVVVSDIVMSETAEYADYVLPVSHWFERESCMAGSISHPYITYQPQVLEPLGESKSDFEIFNLLADKLGYGEYFSLSAEEWMRNLFDGDDARAAGITYDELREKGSMRAVGTDGSTYVFAEGGIFPTDTGRAAFYIEAPEPSNGYPEPDLSKEYLPYWEEAKEAGEHSPAKETYPLHLMCEHSRFRTHSQWHDVEALQEIDSAQFVYINPQDAEAYGIADGDTVMLTSARGSLTSTARIRPNNPPGTMSIVKGWTDKQVIAGHLSNLSNPASNECCANNMFNDIAVAIEKA